MIAETDLCFDMKDTKLRGSFWSKEVDLPILSIQRCQNSTTFDGCKSSEEIEDFVNSHSFTIQAIFD